MGEKEDVQAVVDRFVAGTYTDADIQALRRFHSTGRITLSMGERSMAATGDISDSIIILGDRNLVVKGDGALIVKQVMQEAPRIVPNAGHGRRLEIAKGIVVVLAAGLVLLLVDMWLSQSSTSSPSDKRPPSLETGICNGQPITATIPAGPGEFDRQFGYTFYNTRNSRELAMNSIRSLVMDDTGTWVGYGATSDVGRSGISHISFDLGGYRLWEYCLSIQGRPIVQRSNSIAVGKDGAVWAATDGEGAWRLQKNKWEQFIFDPHANNDAPDPATFALAAIDDHMLVGTIGGVTRWKGASWERILYNKKVHAIAVDSKGDVWIGYISDGASRNPWDSAREDFNVANGALTSDEVRDIAIDQRNRVWVATDGGGLNMYENGKWTAFRAGSNGFPSDRVNVVRVDKYDRVWAGTDRGTVYLDGQMWRTFSNLSTRAIAFGQVPHKSCPPEETAWDVWLGTDDQGLVNSRLPPASVGVTDFRVSNVPATLRPGQTFAPTITVTLETGYDLTQSDFLQTLQDDGSTSNPLIGIPPGITVRGGQSYMFSFADNPMKAPDQAGHFRSTWRLWQCGRYVGPLIPIEFTVVEQ